MSHAGNYFITEETSEIALGFCQTAVQQWGTWEHSEDWGYFLGHYFETQEEAVKDFIRRIADKMGQEVEFPEPHGKTGEKYVVTWYGERPDFEIETEFNDLQEANSFLFDKMDAWDPDRQSRYERPRLHTIVTCCGDDLWCDDFTNTCENCGSDYNKNGQLLTSRDQWED